MIEEALATALRAAVPTAEVFSVAVPEDQPLPWIVYRETNLSSVESFYADSVTVEFEIDAAWERGLEPANYRATKIMAEDIRVLLRSGFELNGVCVDDIKVGKRTDEIDPVDRLHWTRARYTFTYDKAL